MYQQNPSNQKDFSYKATRPLEVMRDHEIQLCICFSLGAV